MVAVALGIWQNVWTWPVGIVNVALTFVVFLREGLYSDMGLQVVYFVLCIYGWQQWLHGGEGRTELPVSRTSNRLWRILVVTGVAMWALLGTITSRLPGAVVPYFDAATTSTSLVAQYMTTRKLIENWVIWILVDAVYVGLFVWRGLFALAALYAVYLLLAVFGYLAWKRTLAPAPA